MTASVFSLGRIRRPGPRPLEVAQPERPAIPKVVCGTGWSSSCRLLQAKVGYGIVSGEAKRKRQKRSAKALSETTLQHTFDTLRAGLNWAVRSRLLAYNPALDVDRPQRDTVEMQVWTFDELGCS